MNTLRDLRASLDQHAGEIPADATVQARVSAVRARAVRVRRRQSGGVVAAAAVVAAVVAVTTWLPNGALQPAGQDRTLLGREAPAEMSALGYTYAFAEGVESEDGASSLELESSDEPRLLTWAAEDTTSVTLVSPGRETRVSQGVGFDDWLVVPPGSEGTYRLREAATALAVYELTDDRPAGTTVDGITFREEVAGARLLDAAVGDLGDGELSISFVAPRGKVRISSLCADGGRGVWVHIDYFGQPGFSSGPTCTDFVFDPGGGGGTTSRSVGRAGERVTLRMYLTDGERGPRVDPAEVRLGLGAYEVPEPVDTIVPGFQAAEVTEYDGHLWTYQRTIRGDGSGVLVFENPGSAQRLVEAAFRGGGRGTILFNDGQQTRGSYRGIGGGGGTTGLVSAPGQQATLRIRGAVPGGLELGFAIYGRAD